MTSYQTFYCTNVKRKCEKNFLTSDHAKHNIEKYDSIGDDKKERKTCVRIKRVKTYSYLTYGQSYKTYMELYVDTPPRKYQ